MDQPKYKPAQLLIQQALLTLLKRQPFGSMTVIQIVSEAGVNRKTFYAYYGSKQECYTGMIRDVFAVLADCLVHEGSPCAGEQSGMLERDIRRFIRETRRHEAQLHTLQNKDCMALALAAADAVIAQKAGLNADAKDPPGVQLQKRLHIKSVRNLIFALLDACMSDCVQDPDVLCGAIESLMQSSAASLLGYAARDAAKGSD